MSNLTIQSNHIPATSDSALAKIDALALESKKLPQVHMPHHHTLHGGMYSRSVMLPAGVVLTGVMIKVPTLLIISGHLRIFSDAGTTEIGGYHVLCGSAYRKSAFLALEDTSMTMVFCTKAETVEEAEKEFTDEVADLMSRMGDAINYTTITGE